MDQIVKREPRSETLNMSTASQYLFPWKMLTLDVGAAPVDLSIW